MHTAANEQEKYDYGLDLISCRSASILIDALTRAERVLKIYIAFLKESTFKRPTSAAYVIAAFASLSTAWDTMPKHTRDAFTLRHSIIEKSKVQ